MVNENIYRNGVRGLLSHYEIETLPDDYNVYKSMFHEATTRKQPDDKYIRKESKWKSFLKKIKRLGFVS